MSDDTTAYPKPKCHLSSGVDGNVYSIIGAVAKALKREGLHGLAKQFTGRALASDSYDAVLRLCHEYVEVE